MIEVETTPLPGVKLIQPAVYGDSRGGFLELWNSAAYESAGLREGFVQDNLSWSARGVVRGLHFQNPQAQAKLVSVLRGAIFDVAVDLRKGSPGYGRWAGYELSEKNRRQLFLPPGLAHGFQALEDDTIVWYKCSAAYAPEHEYSVRWDDPEIGIEWPLTAPQLSRKDAQAPLLKELPARAFFSADERTA